MVKVKVGCWRSEILCLFVGVLRRPKGFLWLMSKDRSIFKIPFSFLTKTNTKVSQVFILQETALWPLKLTNKSLQNMKYWFISLHLLCWSDFLLTLSTFTHSVVFSPLKSFVWYDLVHLFKLPFVHQLCWPLLINVFSQKNITFLFLFLLSH